MGLSYPGLSPTDFGWGQNPMTYGNPMPAMGTGIPDPTVPNYGLAPQVTNFMPKSTAMAPLTGANAGSFPIGENAKGEEPKGLMGWLGKNGGQLDTLAGLVGGIAQIWGGIQANKLAKEQLGFAKSSYETNLANQIKSYNMALEDRIMSRASQNGNSDADARSYIDKHKL